jgi:hypothetical protein
MSTKPCVFCGKPAPQVEGRKPRKYCSDTCRQKDWQQKKNPLKMEKGILVYPADVPEGTVQVIEFNHSPFPPGAKIASSEEKHPGSEIHILSSFNDLLAAAKDPKSDKDYIRKITSDSKKLTPNQKSMIYSKLK